MNEQHRRELTELKQRQLLIRRELEVLSTRLEQLERSIVDDERVETVAGTQASENVIPHAGVTKAPPPIPPSSPKPIAPTELTAPEPPRLYKPVSAVPEQIQMQEFPTAPQPTPRAEKSLELQLGTYWAPRVGIVALLTGLVFLGNLAYQTMGKTGKVLLLYFASAVLLGAGWWQRRTVKETLRSYAQVLFAGGLAALYFTTYAAHHVDNLRIIGSPVLDGVLLLGCATLMVWTADRWKSELLALFGAGLAYYSCIITRAGVFTLYSNLLLATAAVVFLIRNRWATMTSGSVLATYAAYLFWRLLNAQTGKVLAADFWPGTGFLVYYWIIFTSGVFLTRQGAFFGQTRVAFLTLNNGAFFTCFLLTLMRCGRTEIFGEFALVYGAVLLVLSELARKRLATDRLAQDFYVSQGLLILTVGFITKLAGLNLALVLAAQSVVLLLVSQARKSNVLLAAAYITAALATGWCIDGLLLNERSGIYVAGGIGGLMLFNTLLVHRSSPESTKPLLRADRGYFVVLALTSWFAATYDNTSRESFPLIIAAEGLLVTLLVYPFRIREIALLSQIFVVIGQVGWWLAWFAKDGMLPWWNPVVFVSICLLLVHWWQRQKAFQVPLELSLVWQGVFSLCLVSVLTLWLERAHPGATWFTIASVLAAGLTVYGLTTRAWLLCAAGQIPLGIATLQLALQMSESHPAWAHAATPIAALLLMSLIATTWLARHAEAPDSVREPLLQVALGYRWIAIAVSLLWLAEYVPQRERVWVHAAIGCGLFAVAGFRKSREALLASAVYTSVALILFWLPGGRLQPLYWANLCALVTLAAQQQAARRLPGAYAIPTGVHTAVMLVVAFSVWRFSTLWVLQQASGFYLTAGWSFLALLIFAVGILLRERTYRWFGLGLLGCALARVIIFDVWELQTLYRILSFMALGIVLLVLGYIYSKYQEKIKEWL